ncbi:MAG: ATP-dependent helicase/deoxyribonuclease subunit B, partial [Pelotomaculum thermopropionicum]
GVLPARIKEQGIISEGERDGLKTAGINLAPGARRQALDEQYLTYIALSRASELLYLSYSAADDEGGALMPSLVIERVKALLPGVEQRVWPVEPNPALAGDLDFIAGADRTLSYLAAQLREAKAGRPVNPLWWDVYRWFIRGSQREKCARVLSALFFTNREERLPSGTGRELYGRTLRTSVSGMEKFIACPFAHFLSRGLRLQERTAFKLNAPDLGRFFHAALKLFGERVRSEGLEWGALKKEQIGNMAGEAVDLLAPRLQNEILLSTARRRYLTGKLKRTVYRAALVLAEHNRRGSFRPVGLELAFGPGGDLPAVTFTLAGGAEMILTGRIDRVDAAVSDEGIYLRVIDYKSGKMTVKLADIYHGLKMQLMAYLDVVLRHAGLLFSRYELDYFQKALPGAVLYFRIDDPLIKTDGGVPPEAEREKKILKELRMTGMVLSDPAVARLMDGSIKGQSDLIPVYLKSSGELADRSAVLTREQFDLLRAYLRSKLISAGNEIMRGMIDIAPYRRENSGACLNCPYRPVCQFDMLLEGNTYRVIKDEAESVIWDLLKRSAGGDFIE